jgi:hypothetical protein
MKIAFPAKGPMSCGSHKANRDRGSIDTLTVKQNAAV